MIVETPAVQISLEAHRRFHGENHLARVVDQSIEEMAELTHALLKQRRFPSPSLDRRERIVSEMADLCICLEYLGQYFGITNQELRERIGPLAAKIDWECSRERTLR